MNCPHILNLMHQLLVLAWTLKILVHLSLHPTNIIRVIISLIFLTPPFRTIHSCASSFCNMTLHSWRAFLLPFYTVPAQKHILRNCFICISAEETYTWKMPTPFCQIVSCMYSVVICQPCKQLDSRRHLVGIFFMPWYADLTEKFFEGSNIQLALSCAAIFSVWAASIWVSLFSCWSACGSFMILPISWNNSPIFCIWNI